MWKFPYAQNDLHVLNLVYGQIHAHSFSTFIYIHLSTLCLLALIVKEKKGVGVRGGSPFPVGLLLMTIEKEKKRSCRKVEVK